MDQPTQSARAEGSRYLPIILLLFAASGCSALIYETTWYQLLQLSIGSTSVSLGFLLATFMGGLCIGSVWFPRLKLGGQHPLRIYALVEAAIGVCAILIHFLVPLVNYVYIAGAEHGLPGMLLRGFISGVCLLPPTILMGASLPAITRWVKATPMGVSWWGLLYGGNTAGAVFGCLLSGFYLLRLYNMTTATFAAAGINFAVAAISYLLSSRVPAEGSADTPDAPAARSAEPGPAWPVYAAIALSGATALGAEVVWTRLLGMLLGLTVYIFAIILAVFLIGLAIGSWVGSMMVRSVRARLALGWCQMLLTVGIAWTAWIIAKSLPYWPINPLLTISPWHTFQLDLVRCLWAILPPAILWGASFPLAVAALAKPDEDPGRVVGTVYAANTVGCIVGALVVSLALVPWVGSLQSQRIMLWTAAISALIVLWPEVRATKSTGMAAGLAAGLVAAAWLASNMEAVPGELIAYGRRMVLNTGRSEMLYTVEGRNSSVAITRWNDGAIEIDVNGHVEATTETYDMKLQRMVGHLPAILHANPKSVLGIGFGAGVSAGTFTRYPGIEHITICEIEPVIPPTSTKYFGKQNYEVYKNPKTRVVFDDARHYLLTTTDKFDIIASDPLDIFAKGTAAIYSKEYFENVKAHLKPGGLFTLYVPLYETDQRTIRSELATFFAAFPHSTIWANTINGQGYDMVFMGHLEDPKINLDEITARLARPDYSPVLQSLSEIGVTSLTELLATYAGQNNDLGVWSAGAEINTDADLRLQYLGGWGINSTMEDKLYREMLKYRQVPSGLFTGSPERVESV
ncbi:MAG TPA: fused MFS/spermidine synthase, partial [Candidatus Solibacter sp.]|nr:fused MFS/spermidine synthase [Candidatus Solibacter sp.]